MLYSGALDTSPTVSFTPSSTASHSPTIIPSQSDSYCCSLRDDICNCTVQDCTRCLSRYLPRILCPCSSHSMQVWPVQALTPGGEQTDRQHVYTWHSFFHNANDVRRAKHEGDGQYTAICTEKERDGCAQTGAGLHAATKW